ncbi:hypothetical protein C8Q70DRAFT_977272 [Cubamyces menziesii]|nr:hypothetical protein C8Q70DRAFT_977272 [Cubamyces menziesii]
MDAVPTMQPGSEVVESLVEVFPSSDILHDPDFWFNDGNIVIVAKDHYPDARLTGFRVHMGVMSRHSEVFKNLLCQPLPRPKEGEGAATIEGCPQMLVTDSHYDFKQLLHALYDGIGYFTEPEPVGFGELAALVRLGHNYDIAPVYSAGLKRLRAAFDDRAYWVDPPSPDEGTDDERWRPNHWEALIAVNLFRTIEVHDLRAIALYISSTQLTAEQLIRGAEREDHFLERLADDDLARCFEGRLCLLSRRLDYVNSTVLLNSRPGCERAKECSAHLKTLLPEQTYGYANLIGLKLAPRIYRPVQGEQLCGRCTDLYKEREEQFPEELWDGLREIMSMPRSTLEPETPSENTTITAA